MMEALAVAAQERRVQLEPHWLSALEQEFEQPYMQSLRAFLQAEKVKGKIIYPPGKNIFKAFELSPLPKVKVVLLGQDPYHGPNQAHGLCFSVLPGVPIPPSLQNIYKELESDLGIPPKRHGCLEGWAQQGVLLLNSVLTVEANSAGSHQNRGWERFTDQVIAVLTQEQRPMVFILWGSYAFQKGKIIHATQKHLVLTAAHPSPLSAYRGFLGCRHFSKTNAFLESQGLDPIDWSL